MSTGPLPTFEFRTVPSIQVEWSGAKRLGEMLAARFAGRRALVVTDAGLVKAGLLGPVLAGLEAEGFRATVFDAVVADPPESVLLDCVRQAREAGVEIV
ncbi:iron-containing alcohol dehydrogenase, partial [Roseomonas sp. DSM 102946]|nr:iron-containing alcohol dehydrogenase [Roseomonas sp. DSM 102946]